MQGRWFGRVLLVVSLMVLGASAGCGLLAIAGRAIPKSVDAEYKGLAGQKVAVMVWADRGIRIDFPNLQLDTATSIQSFLQGRAKEEQKELKLTTFPWEPRSVLRFQKERPELEGRAVTEYAHRISGITRLIYVEVSEFTTRSDTAVQLLKGTMTGNVKVLEIEAGKSKVVYEKSGISMTFPPRRPEGVLDASENAIYGGTVRALSQEVAGLFYGHVVEE